jgi:transcriptional regulator with XRE-family HTH domain
MAGSSDRPHDQLRTAVVWTDLGSDEMTNENGERRMPRLLLGQRLRELRRRADLFVEDAAGMAGVAQATVWRMERGDVRCRYRPEDVEALGRLYRAGEGVTSALVEMAEVVRREPWYAEYRCVIPEGYETYLELEGFAGRAGEFTPGRLPDLLQTAEYARAAIGATTGLDDAELGLRVELLMARQKVLRRGKAEFVFVVGEAGLRRAVSGGAVMARQLRHLVEVGELANPARVERTRAAFDDLLGRALGEDPSRELIEGMAVRWERMVIPVAAGVEVAVSPNLRRRSHWG